MASNVMNKVADDMQTSLKEDLVFAQHGEALAG